MDNSEEFQDRTSNLTNTETELNSIQQGYIKEITKLVRSIERANHHIQLLNTALVKKAHPRGLISKIRPKIPDSPGKFIIKLEGIQQQTGIQLTETLRDYWIDRSKKLDEELDPIKKSKTRDISSTMEQDTRNHRAYPERPHKIWKGRRAQSR